MKRSKLLRSILLTAGFGLAVIGASALIQVGKGNQAVGDPGWPASAVEVANLKSRVGWMEGPLFGGGQWRFFYCGETAACQAAIDRFAAIETSRLELVIHRGVGTTGFLNDHGRSEADGSYTFRNRPARRVPSIARTLHSRTQ